MPSHAQFEAEAVVWINVAVMFLCIPLFGIYVFETLDGVQDVRYFVNHEARGFAFLEIVITFFVFLMFWMPMTVILKLAASQRNHNLLKMWNLMQLILIFMVALHLLVNPPRTLIIVLAYAVVFLYFLISLWISETLIKEIKTGEPIQFSSLDSEAPPVTLNDNVNQDMVEVLSIPMKKVVVKK